MDLDTIRLERNKRLLKWESGKTAPPLRLIVFPTAKCNLQCRMCKRTHNYPNSYTENLELGEMPIDRWIKITKEAIEMGVKDWWIPGSGEPMMRSDAVVKVVEEVKYHSDDSNIMLTTNGTLFTPLIIRKFVKLGVDRIQFSLDSADPKIHDSIRGVKGSFYRTIKNIRLFNYYKKIFDTDKPDMYVNSVITRKNYTSLDKLAEKSKFLGCSRINLNEMIVYDKATPKIKDLVILDKSKIKGEIENLKSFGSADNFDVSIRIDTGPEKKEITNDRCIGKRNKNQIIERKFLSLPCFEPWYSISIDPYGFISPCCNWGKGKEEFSIVGKSLSEVWYGEYMEYFRDMISEGRLEGPCRGCNMKFVSDEISKELKDYQTSNKKISM